MRKIRFRGLNAKGQWEYGYVVREQFCAYDEVLWPECNNKDFLTYKKADGDVLGADSTIISSGYKIHRDGQQSSVWAKRDTVGQYTGLKDSKGTEIYEGDILNIAGTSWEIIFSFCMFKVSDGFVTQALTEAVCPAKPEAEIIGNIYENPKASESPPSP